MWNSCPEFSHVRAELFEPIDDLEKTIDGRAVTQEAHIEVTILIQPWFAVHGFGLHESRADPSVSIRLLQEFEPCFPSTRLNFCGKLVYLLQRTLFKFLWDLWYIP